MIDKRKVVLVGTGFVGMSMVYSIVNQGIDVNELVLIDVLKDKAEGEAMDISDGIPCSPSHMVVKAGAYSDCKDADIVVITAGLNQKPGQTRLELSEANANIMKDITNQVVESGFNGIFLVASNPVDIMTKVVQEVSGFPTNKVIGSGTALDTSRLRYQIGKYLDISSKNIHAYVMGEHGDSSFVPWEHSYVGCKRIIDIMKDSGRSFSDLDIWLEEIKKNTVKEDISIILVGNKIDLKYRNINTEEAENFAKENNLMYCETSCKEGRNIEMAFDMITKDIIKKQNSKNVIENKDSNVKVVKEREIKREKEVSCC